MQLATSVVVSRGVVTTLYLPLKRLLSRVKKTPFAAAKEKTVNKDQVSGKVEQAVGKLERETVGNDKLSNQGVADQAKRCGEGDLGQR